MALLSLFESYWPLSIAASFANVTAALSVRRLAHKRTPLRSAIAPHALAAFLGGLAAAAGSRLGVELLAFRHEAEGLALVFLPPVFMPTSVGSLSWLANDWIDGFRPRPFWDLVAAIAAAGIMVEVLLRTELYFVAYEFAVSGFDASELAHCIVYFAVAAVLGLPVAATAAAGCAASQAVQRKFATSQP